MAMCLQVIVVDETGSPHCQEVASVHTIAQRGVAMISTAYSTELSSLLADPDLNPLIDGLHQVTMGDSEAR